MTHFNTRCFASNNSTCSLVKYETTIGAKIPANVENVLMIDDKEAAWFGARSRAFARLTTVDAPFSPSAMVIKATQ